MDFFCTERGKMRAVSGVFVKTAAALVRPWRTSGLSEIV